MDALRPEFENKIVAPGDLATRLRQLPRPLVFTNGCFDILHRGHATLLGQARALGASMVVALNSDASVKRLGKGDDEFTLSVPHFALERGEEGVGRDGQGGLLLLHGG